MQKTLLFYDIETTGLNVAFDQVLQFAAVRTDLDLKEISRHEIRIKLREDVIPSPYAIKTHMISIKDMQEGELEVDGIKKIHALLNEPGTISLGYNTLGFDDEFLRFSFYRNLLPVYTHQYANQCSRADIYPIAMLYYLFGKDEVKWPEKNGRVSLKLENINSLNKLAEGQAHDAMVDVDATVELAKLLKKNEEMWNYCLGYFNKKIDTDRISKLDGEAIYLMGKLGHKNNFHAPALCLGQHWHYKNQLVYLRLDLPELQTTKIDDLEKTTWTLKKKLGEPGIILPTNERFMKHLSKERLDIANQNKAWLSKNPKIKQAISDHYLDYKFQIVPEADVDSTLYQNGFNSRHDDELAKQFHLTRPEEQAKLIEQFDSHELQTLATRLIGRNHPEHLSKELEKTYQVYLKQIQNSEKIIDYRKQTRYTPLEAKEDIAKILADPETTKEQIAILEYT
jgi:exodeoxyribonuclease I